MTITATNVEHTIHTLMQRSLRAQVALLKDRRAGRPTNHITAGRLEGYLQALALLQGCEVREVRTLVREGAEDLDTDC